MAADETTRADVPILKIIEHASTLAGTVVGDCYPVDHGSDSLVFYVNVGTGATIIIQGRIRHEAADGTVTDDKATFDTFGASGSITTTGLYVVTVGAGLFTGVRAQTTVKPSAGTAYVLMSRG